MQGNTFETRAEQVDAFFQDIVRMFKESGVKLPRKVKAAIKESLQDACILGAYEERTRTLNFLSCYPDIRREITAKTVSSVLGFEE